MRRKTKHKLTRVVFQVSRLMEFCTKRELQNQTGHSVYDWPLVVLKELMDNALDACEEAEVAPVIEVAVAPGSITITDNADGFAAKTIDAILARNNAQAEGLSFRGTPSFIVGKFRVPGVLTMAEFEQVIADARKAKASN